MFLECGSDMSPNLFEVAFAVFREKSSEGRFFKKGTFDFVWEELGNFPMVDGVRVPGFVFAMFFVFGDCGG